MNVNDSENLIVKYYTTTDGVENQGVDVTNICQWNVPVGFTVDKGKVLATKPGASGIITASYSGETATCSVVCENQMTYGLVLDTTSVDISVGEQKQVIAYYVTYKNGEEFGRIDVTDTGKWTPSHTHIKVDKGKITLNGYGESGTVTVSYNGFEATVNVNVISIVTEKLIIYSGGFPFENVYLTANSPHQLEVYYITEDNGVEKSRVNVTTSTSCNWHSDNDDITVYMGLVNSTKGGVNGVITASYNNIEKSINIIVNDLITYELVITPSQHTMNMGEEYQFTAELIKYVNGSETNKTYVTKENGITWDCGSTVAVGSVDGGLFKPAKSGIVTISATYSNAEVGLVKSNKVTVYIQSDVKYELVSE
jgi:hypothetical protein